MTNYHAVGFRFALPNLRQISKLYSCNFSLANSQLSFITLIPLVFAPVSYTHLRAHETGSVSELASCESKVSEGKVARVKFGNLP